MLTHKNILFIGFTNFEKFTENDRFLSVLPLAHVFQRICTLWLLRWNVPIYFFNDPNSINTALKEVKPTLTAFVPRVIEKIYAKIITKLETEGFLKRVIGHWAFNIAFDPDAEHQLSLQLADKIVYQKVRKAFGGHLKAIVCGSAYLNPALVRFFHRLGIKIIEGYGMTEMMVISANSLERVKIGTAGLPCPEVEIKISPEG